MIFPLQCAYCTIHWGANTRYLFYWLITTYTHTHFYDDHIMLTLTHPIDTYMQMTSNKFRCVRCFTNVKNVYSPLELLAYNFQLYKLAASIPSYINL